MASLTEMIAKDGTRFRVYNQGNGDYVASLDDDGSHHAPPQWQSLPTWDCATATARLRDAVASHEAQCAMRADAERRGDCPACGQRGPLAANHYLQGHCTGRDE